MGRRKWLVPTPPTPLKTTTLQSPPSTKTTFANTQLQLPLSPSPTSSSSSSSNLTTTTTITVPPQTQNTTSQTSPLAPPPRLYLRTLLPSPPLPTSYLTTAPETPYPWIWRCHLCRSIYRLGVTRRCLEDGHLFCSVESPPPSPVLPPATPVKANLETVQVSEGTHNHTKDGGKHGGREGENSKEEEVKSIIKRAKAAKQKRRKDKKRVAQRGCMAEFDYTAWSAYNGWRRERRSAKLAVKMRGQMEVARGILGREKLVDGHGDGNVQASGKPMDRGAREGSITTDSDITPRDTRAALRASYNNKDKEQDRTKGKEPVRPQSFLPETLSWNGKPADGRDCWRDCDFPSECHNERKAEREWEARMKALRKWDEEWRAMVEREGREKDGKEVLEGKGMKGGKGGKRRREVSEGRGSDEILGGSIRDASGKGDGDDDTLMSGVDLISGKTTDSEIDAGTDVGIEFEEDDTAWDPYSQPAVLPTISKLGSSSASHPKSTSPTKHTPPLIITTSEPNIDFTTSIPLFLSLPSSIPNLGPLGTDCDGLGEAGYQLSHMQSMRRKSIENSIRECSPKSPLKAVFGFGDLDEVG